LKIRRNIVGPIVRELREKQKLTQPLLVARLNLNGWDLGRVTLTKIETGLRCVTDYELGLLAKALKVDAGTLLNKAICDSAKNKIEPTSKGR
jgi:transcriptional regulator with XRE-family HTH domain